MSQSLHASMGYCCPIWLVKANNTRTRPILITPSLNMVDAILLYVLTLSCSMSEWYLFALWGFTSVDPAQVLRTSISFSCWVFASYLFPVLVSVVYRQYLFQEDSLESDRWMLDRVDGMTQIETSIRLWISSRWPISFCCTDFLQLYSFSILCWYP